MLFAQFALPILDSFCALVLTWIESLKGKSSIKIAKYNKQVMDINNEETPKHIIGFALPDSEENEDEYNED